jgi:predicted nucleic acid-binding Zn ribbon protein
MGWSRTATQPTVESNSMPTYVYEVISQDHGAEVRRFEMFQRITDAPLTVDPGSGQPVVRVVTGGMGIRLKGLKRSTVVNKKSAAATACGCGARR